MGSVVLGWGIFVAFGGYAGLHWWLVYCGYCLWCMD